MFPVGHVLHDTYRIVRVLGQGGMGSLFEVEHLRLPRRFALKVMAAPAAKSQEFMLRFRREAEILASLDHPNVVTVLDWNIAPAGQPYLVMELLTGENLAQHLQRNGALPPRVAISILAQAVAALEVAHSHGITHRDLKPANIFLCKNGVVPYFTKVLDFGIAKSAQHTSTLVTNHLVLMGTPAYMAPEQARGDIAGVDARADQFSLGLVLYEMLSGRPAFYRRGEPAMNTICRVMTEDPPPLPDVGMNHAIMRALRKQPEERYRSMSELLSAVMAAALVPPELIEVPELTDRLTARPVNAPREIGKKPPLLGSRAWPVVVPETKSSPAVTSGPVERSRSSRPLLPSTIPPHASAPTPTPSAASVPQSLVIEAPRSQPPSTRSDCRPAEPPRPRSRPARSRLRVFIGAGSVGIILTSLGFVSMATTSGEHSLPDAVPTLADLGAAPADLASAAPAVSLQPPPDLSTSADLCVSPPRKRARPEIRVVGLPARSESAQAITRCVNEALSPAALRKHLDAPIELMRTGRTYHVITQRMQPERAMLLEQCLEDASGKLQSAPSSLDIKIVEVPSP